MQSNPVCSPFVEHSFRRLTRLIHQQDDLRNRSIEPSFDSSPLNSDARNNEFTSLATKMTSRPQSINAPASTVKSNPTARSHRTYMRPPKQRTTGLYRCSSSQLSEASFNRSFDSPCSPSTTRQESNDLPIHTPRGQTLYDVRFERDRQNDARQRHNVPSPFQRTWLRQPRYVPQERPNYGHMQQSPSQ